MKKICTKCIHCIEAESENDYDSQTEYQCSQDDVVAAIGRGGLPLCGSINFNGDCIYFQPEPDGDEG